MIDSKEGEQIRESPSEESILRKRPKAMEEPATWRQYLEEVQILKRQKQTHKTILQCSRNIRKVE